MRKHVYFSADWHFGHYNIIKYCKRPFKDIEEMDEYIIEQHNKIVKKNDTFYCLGDAGDCKHVKRLNGFKILIKGNHDKKSNGYYLKSGFSLVLESAMIKSGKKFLTLEHIPRRNFKEFIRLMLVYWRNKTGRSKNLVHKWNRLKREWKKHEYPIRDYVHLCGHVHKAWTICKNNINIGGDVWGYKPVSLDKVMAMVNKKPKKRRIYEI